MPTNLIPHVPGCPCEGCVAIPGGRVVIIETVDCEHCGEPMRVRPDDAVREQLAMRVTELERENARLEARCAQLHEQLEIARGRS